MPSKNEYATLLNARLEVWNRELAELERRAAASADLERTVAELRRLRDAAAKETRAVERAHELDWELRMEDAEREFEALGDAFGRARVHFRE